MKRWLKGVPLPLAMHRAKGKRPTKREKVMDLLAALRRRWRERNARKP